SAGVARGVDCDAARIRRPGNTPTRARGLNPTENTRLQEIPMAIRLAPRAPRTLFALISVMLLSTHAATAAEAGAAIYKEHCAACHDTGVTRAADRAIACEVASGRDPQDAHPGQHVRCGQGPAAPAD